MNSSNYYTDINHFTNKPRIIFFRNIYEIPRINKVIINRGLSMRAKLVKIIKASLLKRTQLKKSLLQLYGQSQPDSDLLWCLLTYHDVRVLLDVPAQVHDSVD